MLRAEPRDGRVVVTVRDAGMGIAADKQDQVFEKFFRVDASDTRRFAGTGLGLAICRGIVQAHGGTIWVESREGHGSTFAFQPGRGGGGCVSRADEPAATILVVDDEPRYVRWISVNLRASGYRVLTASDGQAALEITAAERPDLLLLDIGLPVVTGLDVCRRIREFSTVPIIMVTAKAAEADTVAGLDAGADDYLPKPFGPPELMARVRAALRRARYAEAPTSEPLFQHGDLTIDFARHAVSRGGQPLALTPTEYKLLVQLARHAGRVLLPEDLLSAVWGPEYREETQHVRLYVSRLRRKIEPDPEHPRYVLTRAGIGYLFAASE